MKYIFLIIIAFLIVQEVPAQIRLSTMDSVTTFAPTDLFWLNTKPSASFVNRKVSWAYLRSNMIDYVDGLANTWALKQTFSSGAIFSAGANGYVQFSDSVLVPSAIYSKKYNPYDATSTMGSSASPMAQIWTRALYFPNTEGNDSVAFSYDDSTLTIDKTVSIANLSITNQFQTPDSASITGLALSQTSYSPAFVTDTVITLSSVASSLEIAPPGSMAEGIEKILMTGAGDGQILVITNRIAVTIVFEDNEADGNLLLDSDFSMGQWQPLMLMYNSKISKWIEISRSAN